MYFSDCCRPMRGMVTGQMPVLAYVGSDRHNVIVF